MGGLKGLVGSIYLERSGKTLHRAGVVGELVNAATVNLFTITGGPVVASMFGIITAAIGANITTVQLSNGTHDMSAASGSLSGQIVGIHLNPTGGIAVAMAIGAATLVGVYQATRWSLGVGSVSILVGGATSATGAIDWYITYEPMVPGAIVAVA